MKRVPDTKNGTPIKGVPFKFAMVGLDRRVCNHRAATQPQRSECSRASSNRSTGSGTRTG